MNVQFLTSLERKEVTKKQLKTKKPMFFLFALLDWKKYMLAFSMFKKKTGHMYFVCSWPCLGLLNWSQKVDNIAIKLGP